MEICVRTEKFKDCKDELVVLPFSEEDVQDLIEDSSSKLDDYLVTAMDDHYFMGKANETCLLVNVDLVNAKRLLLVGLGKDNKINFDSIRKSYANVVRKAKSVKVSKITVVLPVQPGLKAEDIATAVVEGVALRNYVFDKYKTKKEDKAERIKELVLLCDDKQADVVADNAYHAITLCENTNIARDLVNDTTYEVHPEKLAAFAKSMALKAKLKCTVLDQKEIKKQGLNLLYEVGKASDHDSHLVILEYTGNKASKDKVALIGKGITFDAGGMNLKPTGYLESMRYDMAGAASVIATMKALAELKVKRNVVAVVPMCENMIGSLAYKPGDIIKSYSGKTVEVMNTDAEGRLILADAVSYAIKNYKPTAIIDIATLTGSCLSTFGEHVAAIIGNNKEIADRLYKAGQETNERVWELPYYDEYKEEMKSDLADIKNTGYKNGRYAGTITAAAFIGFFINDTPWMHIDVAGTSWRESEKGYYNVGATGYRVRLLTRFFLDI